MGAPEGNQFWKLRSKHGRDKLFATPDLLWDAACEYFQWVDEHKWEKVETTVKPNGIEYKTIPTERPYTIDGFCLYCHTSRQWLFQFKKNENNKDFLYIITRIEDLIYNQKFEGAAVGAFNANIIARDLGLRDNQAIDHTGEIKAKLDFTVDSSETFKTLQKLRSEQDKID